jgi:hypothetical protein
MQSPLIAAITDVVVADEDARHAAGDDHGAHRIVLGERGHRLQHLARASGGHRADRRVGVGDDGDAAAPLGADQ